MKNTVTKSEFIDSFTRCGRESNFSYEGRKALFSYFEELENDCGIEIEFDVVGICCEYTEYDSFEEILENYCNVGDKDNLHDLTQVIEFDGGLIIRDF